MMLEWILFYPELVYVASQVAAAVPPIYSEYGYACPETVVCPMTAHLDLLCYCCWFQCVCSRMVALAS